MSWSITWGGRASDVLQDHFPVNGMPGPSTRVACRAIWEALQAVAELNPEAYARVTANGFTDLGDKFAGRISIAIQVKGSASELDAQLEAQQPVDLLRGTPASVHTTAPLSAEDQEIA